MGWSLDSLGSECSLAHQEVIKTGSKSGRSYANWFFGLKSIKTFSFHCTITLDIHNDKITQYYTKYASDLGLSDEPKMNCEK